jgi:hypothetical protein
MFKQHSLRNGREKLGLPQCPFREEILREIGVMEMLDTHYKQSARRLRISFAGTVRAPFSYHLRPQLSSAREENPPRGDGMIQRRRNFFIRWGNVW